MEEQIRQARNEASRPLSESWGDFQGLATILRDAPDPDDVRLRLRMLMRRIADEAWLLIVPRGEVRLCAVQIRFAGGEKHRDYLIYWRMSKANASYRRDGELHMGSLADADKFGGFDLRNRGDAKKLESILVKAEPADRWRPRTQNKRFGDAMRRWKGFRSSLRRVDPHRPFLPPHDSLPKDPEKSRR